jgi:hypothetical protein
MPAHLFHGAVRVDYQTAVRADFERQNCSICPRYWYLDVTFACDRCGGEFVFKATEQRVWYEEYGFWIDSLPKHCLACRRDRRDLKATRQEYDRLVAEALQAADIELKRRLAGIIDRLYELGGQLPSRINENRRRLALQIAKADQA